MSNEPSEHPHPSDPDVRRYGKPSVTRDHPRFLRMSQAGIGRDRNGRKSLVIVALLVSGLIGAIALVSTLVMVDFWRTPSSPPTPQPTTEPSAD